MAAFTAFGAAPWFDTMTKSGRFVARRLEEDMKAQQALLACSTPEDVLRVQADYYRTAIAQYSAETGRIVEVYLGAMGGPFAKSRSPFAREYDDVPL
jgi:hypothetical protein